MLFRILKEFSREKRREWDALSFSDQTKKCMAFVDWTFKYIAWCALTAAMIRYTKESKSNELMIVTTGMGLLLVYFMSLPPSRLVAEFLAQGKANGDQRRILEWVLRIFISLTALIPAMYIMDRVIDMVVMLSQVK